MRFRSVLVAAPLMLGALALALSSSVAGPALAAGGPWTQSTLTNLTVDDLAVAPSRPSVVYAATISGVFRSDDGGATWTVLGAPETAPRGEQALSVVVDPTNPNVVYASTSAGLFKTTDGGQTWTRLGSDAANPSDTSGAGSSPVTFAKLVMSRADPNRLYAIGSPQWRSAGFFRSANGGATWEKAGPASFPAVSLAVAPYDPNTLYAGLLEAGLSSTINTNLMKSVDGGSTWQALNTGVPIGVATTALWVDLVNQNVVYAGTTGLGVYRSTDAGATWTPASNGLPPTDTITSLAMAPGSRALYAATAANGVFRTLDQGGTWQPVGAGLPQNSQLKTLTIAAIGGHARVVAGSSDAVWYADDPDIVASAVPVRIFLPLVRR